MSRVAGLVGGARPRKRHRENLAGYLFVLPNLVGFLVFTVFGVGFSLYMSFTDWSLIKQFKNIEWVGFSNYSRLLGDGWFRASVVNTCWFFLAVPVTIFLAMIFAFILNDKVFLRRTFRTILYLPYITSLVAISVIWFTLFHPRSGPVNQFLMALGIAEPPQWLSSSAWAKPTIAILWVWRYVGYYTLLYVAALQGIPRQLYEAATVDGASAFRQFFGITIPLISPTTFLLTVMSVIAVFQDWALVQIMTAGGPGTSTYTIGYYIYYSAFRKMKMGYASSIAWVLLLAMMAFTCLRFKIEKDKDY